jgi:DNA-binding HxlR family transcriptional regulator
MKTKKEGNNYYYKVPAELIESGELTKAALYGVVVRLASNIDCICTASNGYLAKRIGRKDCSVISKYLQELEKENWISMTHYPERGNRRDIRLSPHRKNTMTPYEKSENLSSEKTKENINNIKIINNRSSLSLKEDKEPHSNNFFPRLLDHYDNEETPMEEIDFFN